MTDREQKWRLVVECDDTVHQLPLGSKSSPGPWGLCKHLRDNDKCSCGYRGGIWDSSGEFMICEMGATPCWDGVDLVASPDRSTTQANARLIAAAPCMAEALERAANSLAMARERLESSGWMNAAKDCFEDELAARSALRKARGEE